MRCVILLGTLKKTGLSNTQTLCEFLTKRMEGKNIECEILKLVEYKIVQGTYDNMGDGDDWPILLRKVLMSDILIFATPVWWGGHSSEIQRVIERLDNIHDEIMEGKESRLAGKVGGIVITGDSDGAQHILGNIANFFNALGVTLPPFGTLSILLEMQAKNTNTSREDLIKKYRSDYTNTADKMIGQLIKYAQKEKTSAGTLFN